MALGRIIVLISAAGLLSLHHYRCTSSAVGSDAECQSILLQRQENNIMRFVIDGYEFQYDATMLAVITDSLFWQMYDNRDSLVSTLVRSVACVDTIIATTYNGNPYYVVRGALSLKILHALYGFDLYGEGGVLNVGKIVDCLDPSGFPCSFTRGYHYYASDYSRRIDSLYRNDMLRQFVNYDRDTIRFAIMDSLSISYDPIRGIFIHDDKYYWLKANRLKALELFKNAILDNGIVVIRSCGRSDTVTVGALSAALFSELYGLRCSGMLRELAINGYHCLGPCDYRALHVIRDQRSEVERWVMYHVLRLRTKNKTE